MAREGKRGGAGDPFASNVLSFRSVAHGVWCFSFCCKTPGNCSFVPARPVPDEYEARWAALRPQLTEAECEAMNEIMGMVGLRQVKQTALSLFEILLANRALVDQGHHKAATPMTLNFVFLGNPGCVCACWWSSRASYAHCRLVVVVVVVVACRCR